MPLGLWRMSGPVELDKVRRGQVVAFCPPPEFEIFREAKVKGILQDGSCSGSFMPLLKEVAGLPGDVIEYTNLFSVNGRQVPNSQILAIDLGDARVPLFSRLVVPAGKVWLMSSHSDLSFDSRYFGLVDIERVVGLAEPLIVSN
jgi:conjugative transfer signal peptidase TraF